MITLLLSFLFVQYFDKYLLFAWLSFIFSWSLTLLWMRLICLTATFTSHKIPLLYLFNRRSVVHDSIALFLPQSTSS